MMGHTHALSGAAAWLALTPVVTDHGLLHDYALSLSPTQIAAGTVVCAGAALLPDMDHHSGTIANTFGMITKLLCRLVAQISGGHRHATHSLLFTLGMGFGCYWLATHQHGIWLGVLFLLIGLGLRGIGFGFDEIDHLTGLLNALLAGALVYMMRDIDMAFAGYAVGIGCLAHVVGDCLTPEGCPVFWPVPNRLSVPLVPRTHGKVELMIVAPLLTLIIVVLAAHSAFGDQTTQWLHPGWWKSRG
jgi:membrane-bound metal-dependent hydrolase YbcI (DUF457 family)